MDKVAARPTVEVTTLRLARPLHDKLVLLQQTLGKPLNKLVNDALGDFVARRTAEVELDLEQTLQRIRAASKRDPRFKKAIAEFAAAIFMRYGVEPVVRMRPRPAHGYGAAGASAMRGNWGQTALAGVAASRARP